MRDTDDDWRKIGASEPYFGVLTHEPFLRRNLDSAGLKQFYGSGEQEVKKLLGQIRQFGRFKPKSAIDFGCGVGRLTRAMAAHVDQVYGVDVSEPMLEVARDGAPRNAHFATTLPDALVDWVSSVIVFQHIPPARGYDLFEALLGRLAPGGWMSIQITLYRDERQTGSPTPFIRRASWDGERMVTYADAPMDPENPVRNILMYDYDLTRLFAIANDAGINGMTMIGTNHGGHYGAYLYGQKSA